MHKSDILPGPPSGDALRPLAWSSGVPVSASVAADCPPPSSSLQSKYAESRLVSRTLASELGLVSRILRSRAGLQDPRV